MILVKFKRYTFLILGVLVSLTSLYVSIRSGFALGYAANISTGWKIALSSLISLIILMALVIIMVLLEAWISGSNNKKHSFAVSVVCIFMQRHYKWVYHNELGYFFVAFEGDQICVHKQGIFVIKELFSIDNTGDINSVSKSIKQSLDKLYSSKVREEKSWKERRDKINAMKKWDGYLDSQGRRDGKIKEILK
jgi:hypothetical protein